MARVCEAGRRRKAEHSAVNGEGGIRDFVYEVEGGEGRLEAGDGDGEGDGGELY